MPGLRSQAFPLSPPPVNPADLSAFKTDPLAAAVLSQIAAGKWRKARDSAKELFKKDRAKYLPLLVAANAGLAEEMLSRGLTQDAATVIAYLKTIAPPAEVQALEARLLQKQSAAVLTKGTPAEMLATAWRIVSTAPPGPPSKELLQAADRLVVSESLPQGEDAPELRRELESLRVAVKATGLADWEGAKTALRGIPAQSVFGNWRLFLRGVRCSHSGELEAARQCFEALPAGTATARAAWAYRQICGLPVTGDQPPSVHRITYPAALTGVPAQAAAALLEAEAAWRKKDLFGAYITLTSGYGRGEFPSDQPGPAGTLTDRFLACGFRGFHVGDDHFADFLDGLEARLNQLQQRQAAPREEKRIRLQLLRLEGQELSGPDVLEHAARIVELDTQLYGRQPLRAAAVWELAAERLKGERMVDEYDDSVTIPVEERTEALRRCMELDPAHPPRLLALAEHLDARKQDKELGKLMDKALKLHPDHPGILAMAGTTAWKTGRLDAVALLQKAVRLDPANKDAADALFARLEAKATSAREFNAAFWDDLEPLTRPTPAKLPDSPDALGLERQRWFFKLRRLVEDPETATAPASPALDSALRLAPSPWVGNLALALLRNSPLPAKADGDSPPSAAPEAKLTWQDLYWALHLMQWASLQHDSQNCLRGMDKFLASAAAPLLTKAALCLPEGAKGLLAWARSIFAILEKADHERDEALPCEFILKVARAVENPMVRMVTYEAELASILLPIHCSPYGPSCSCQVLGQIERAARARGDNSSVAFAAKLISRCGDLPAPPWTQAKFLNRIKNKRSASAANKKPAKKAAGPTEKAPAKKTTAKKTPAKKAAAANKNAILEAGRSIDDLIDTLRKLQQPDLFD